LIESAANLLTFPRSLRASPKEIGRFEDEVTNSLTFRAVPASFVIDMTIKNREIYRAVKAKSDF
jgi:hypothetical protein